MYCYRCEFHSLTRSFLVNFAANPLSVYIALSFENVQICLRISEANNKILDFVFSNALPLTCIRVNLLKLSPPSGDLKRNEVANNYVLN